MYPSLMLASVRRRLESLFAKVTRIIKVLLKLKLIKFNFIITMGKVAHCCALKDINWLSLQSSAENNPDYSGKFGLFRIKNPINYP